MKTILAIMLLALATTGWSAETPTRDLLTVGEKAMYDSSARDSDALVRLVGERANAAAAALAPSLQRIVQLEAQIVALNAEIALLRAQIAAGGGNNPALVAENTKLKADNAQLRAVIDWYGKPFWNRGPKPPMPAP